MLPSPDIIANTVDDREGVLLSVLEYTLVVFVPCASKYS